MACHADDVLHHGYRYLHSVLVIRRVYRSDTAAVVIFPLADRYPALLLRSDTVA